MEDFRMVRLETPYHIYTYPDFSYISSSPEGGVQYLKVPPDILVGDFILFLTQLTPHHTTHVDKLYRQVSNGYRRAEMDEKLITGSSNEIESFLLNR